MWTNVLILALIPFASSRHVIYDQNSDIVAILEDIFGLNAKAQDGVIFADGSARQSKVDAADYRQVTEPAEYFNQLFDKHWNHAHNEHNHNGNRQGINGKTTESNEVFTEHTHKPVNRHGDIHRTKTNNPGKPDRNTTKTNPVTENITNTQNTSKTTPTEHSTATTKTTKHENAAKEPNLKNGVSTAKTSTVDEDRWIWDSGTTTAKPTTPKSTTPKSTTLGLDDRAAFSGDSCPTNQVKVGNICVDED